MEKVEWSASLSIGVAHIDEEHKQFLVILNELGQAVEGSRAQVGASQAIARMRDYAQMHFKTEEDAMTATRYGARTGHVAEHDQFIEQVLDLDEALAKGQTVHAGEIWSFLRGWLTRHIMEYDKRLGIHLCANGMN